MSSYRHLAKIDDPALFQDAVRARYQRQTQGGSGRARAASGQKKHAKAIRRRTLAAWRRQHPGVYLPPPPPPKMSLSGVPDPDRIKIVLLPDSDADLGLIGVAAAEAPGTNRPTGDGWKKVKRFLYAAGQMLAPRDKAALHDVSRRDLALPIMNPDTMGVASSKSRTRLRSLSSLGVLLAADLSADIEAALIRAGARIQDNIRICGVEPVAGDFASAGTRAPVEKPDPWHLSVMGIEPDEKAPTAARIGIGFLDTGIDRAHREFAGRDVRFMAFDAEGKKMPLQDVKDYGTHGTHVAALAAGTHMGVARHCRIAMAAVLTDYGKGRLAQVLAGLQWLTTEAMIEMRAGIINASLEADGIDLNLWSQFDRAAELMLVVAASGNKGKTPTLPGGMATVLSVGATDRGGNICDFTSRGDVAQPGGSTVYKPDVYAPGKDIISARANRNDYTVDSGTSMAAPIIAGVAALTIARDPWLADDPGALHAALKGRFGTASKGA